MELKSLGGEVPKAGKLVYEEGEAVSEWAEVDQVRKAPVASHGREAESCVRPSSISSGPKRSCSKAGT